MKTSMKTFGIIGALALMCMPTPAARAQTATARMVTAARGLLSSLDEKQRARVLFAFTDDKQRAKWSNFPNGIFQRAGLSLGELNAAQRSAAMGLVSAALSPKGYEKVLQIMDADEALKTGARNNPMFGKDLYFVSILGTPSDKDPWMLQFGGHHLALNVTVVGAHGILTPTLTGAQPALYVANGVTIRPLGRENDKAFALLNALDATQREQAILKYRVADLVLGPGQDGRTIQPEGLKASAMNAAQRAMLLDLASEWTGIVHDSAAVARMQEIRAGLDETWFAWSGPTSVAVGKNGTSYYRIQGPKLVIEYAPQQMGGDPSNHIHTMYRDPTNDYGRGLIPK